MARSAPVHCLTLRKYEEKKFWKKKFSKIFKISIFFLSLKVQKCAKTRVFWTIFTKCNLTTISNIDLQLVGGVKNCELDSPRHVDIF